MFRAVVLVFVLTTTLAQQEFFQKYAFSKVMVSCLGSTNYYNFIYHVSEAMRQCNNEPQTRILDAGVPPYSYAAQSSLNTDEVSDDDRYRPISTSPSIPSRRDPNLVFPDTNNRLPNTDTSQGSSGTKLHLGDPIGVTVEYNPSKTDRPESGSQTNTFLNTQGSFPTRSRRPNPFGDQSGVSSSFPYPQESYNNGYNRHNYPQGSYNNDYNRPNYPQESYNNGYNRPNYPQESYNNDYNRHNHHQGSYNNDYNRHNYHRGSYNNDYNRYNYPTVVNQPGRAPSQGGAVRPLWDASTLTKAYDKVNAALSNLTCVLKNINAIDSELNIKYDSFVNYYYSIPIHPYLRRDLVQGINFCKRFTLCMPMETRESILPPQVHAIMAFLKCEKRSRIASCFKNDLRLNQDQFDLSGLPNPNGQPHSLNKLMILLIGADSADDLEVY